MSVSSVSSQLDTQFMAPRRPLAGGQPSPESTPVLTNTEAYVPGSAWVGSTPKEFILDLPSAMGQTSPDTLQFSPPQQPAPKLDRPVLLVHGYNATAESWKNMRTWLTGNNPDGGVVGPGTGEVDAKGMVFCAEFSRPYNGIKMNASELKDTIDRIVAATGAREIDLVTHSMGGLNTRYYLNDGGDRVKNLVMIAPPDHGSLLADIDLKFREMGMPMMPRVDDDEVRQCFHDLSEDRVDHGKQNNPVLHALNRHTGHQRPRPNTLIIAGCGTPTLQSKSILTVRGDGVVSRTSAQLDKIPLKTVWWTTHTNVTDARETLTATADFLTGKRVDVREQDPPNIPPDTDVVPVNISCDGNQLHYVIQDKQTYDTTHRQ